MFKAVVDTAHVRQRDIRRERECRDKERERDEETLAGSESDAHGVRPLASREPPRAVAHPQLGMDSCG